MVSFDVALQLSEDGEVGLHPVNMSLVSGRKEEETQTPVNTFFQRGSNLLSLKTSAVHQWRLGEKSLSYSSETEINVN